MVPKSWYQQTERAVEAAYRHSGTRAKFRASLSRVGNPRSKSRSGMLNSASPGSPSTAISRQGGIGPDSETRPARDRLSLASGTVLSDYLS